MLIGAARLTCPACQGEDLSIASIVHHRICAYVGPDYDFKAEGGCRCPKCLRALHDRDRYAEIVGESARCRRCGAEFVVPDGASRRA